MGALAFASPIPEEGMDAPVALPYVHGVTGDVADAASPVAETYVHDVTGDVALAYVHQEPVVAPVAVAAPALTYAAYPYTYGAYPYLAAGAHVVAPAAAAAPAPVTYAAYNHYGYAGYPYAAYHTGCVNSVGSVVPCAQ